MIRSVRIENYKSIADLTLEMGSVNVLVGANGCGKSNILEAIALASAAANCKLDNEFLSSRGVRVTDTRFMHSAFDVRQPPSSENGNFAQKILNAEVENTIRLSVTADNHGPFSCKLWTDETGTYPKWKQSSTLDPTDVSEFFKVENLTSGTLFTSDILQKLFGQKTGHLPAFLIFAPENAALHRFQDEGQILPLGIRGEGLFSHLKALNAEVYRERMKQIQEKLALIDWFDSFEFPEDLGPGERRIRIRDRFLPKDALFDQRSANEGFLFLLFYLTLFISPDTPKFFAIDNVDNSLNPKLCSELLWQLAPNGFSGSER